MLNHIRDLESSSKFINKVVVTNFKVIKRIRDSDSIADKWTASRILINDRYSNWMCPSGLNKYLFLDFFINNQSQRIHLFEHYLVEFFHPQSIRYYFTAIVFAHLVLQDKKSFS